jgi:2-haloacid dehalogenase
MPGQPALVFDSNGTLLDLGKLNDRFAEIFGMNAARELWFDEVLHAAMTTAVTGGYLGFDVLAEAALEKLAAERRVDLSQDIKRDVLDLVGRLPPYPDVEPGLERLREAGFRLAVLTNSTPAMASRQIEHAGLAPLFERVLSVEPTRHYKPAPEPYQMAARELGREIGDLLLVTAHDWDLKGATHAGCGGAFLKRPGKAWFPAYEPPVIVADDLVDAAEQIIAKYG